jgi:anthranilate phosphoribosyltransferase
MIREALAKVVERQDLSSEEAREVMREMMAGIATQNQISSFITAMRMKGEKEQELLGFARAMRESASRITAPPDAVDLCGTGGDGAHTFNVSTVASFAVCAAGVPVAKHGNRSVSSKSGSADLLEALGIPCDLDPPDVEESINTTGFGFLFAPIFHSSMRHVLGPRRELGLRTFFNILGPLSNPARVKYQLVGVYDPSLMQTMARVLRDLGVSRAMVVHGDGTDEITVSGRSSVVELKSGSIREYEINPKGFGFAHADQEALVGGSPSDNARITLSILKGERSARRDMVTLNAGAALYLAGRVERLDDGVDLASAAIASGKAYSKLKEFAAFASQREAKRQMGLSSSVLATRRLQPKVLRDRCSDVTFELVSKIRGLKGGNAELQMLEGDMISHPTVLSVLFLTRSIRVLSDGVYEPGGMRKPSTRFSDALSTEGVSIIAEYKPRSTSAAPLDLAPDPTTTVNGFERAGASAVSVLVEGDYFGGGPELFSMLRSQVHLPMLFKDFVTSPRQIEMARALGANAILLIAKALRSDALDYLVRSTISAGMEPLVEVHDEQDIQKLVSCDAFDLVKMVGINSRDLRTLDIDLNRLDSLSRLVPNDRILVAESGITTPEDISALHAFDAALVGSALMRSDMPEKTLSSLVKAGKGVVS